MARSERRLITGTLGFDGGRQLTVHLPSEPAAAIIYAGDGQVAARWGEDLDPLDVPPTVVVGVHASVDETRRLHEYSPAFDPDLFAAHERFFTGEVRNWVTSQLGLSLPAERTAVLGVSAGGELALALGLRHPDVYGTVLCASPGAGYRPAEPLPDPLPRTYLVAGTEEPFFLDNAVRWERALRRAGADVVLKQREGTHGGPFWRQELPHMVAWAFSE